MKIKYFAVFVLICAMMPIIADELSGKTLYEISHMQVLRDGRLYGFLNGKYTFSTDETYRLDRISDVDEKTKSYTIVQYSIEQDQTFLILNDEQKRILIKTGGDIYMLTQSDSSGEYSLCDSMTWLVPEQTVRKMVLDNPDFPTFEGH